MIEMTLDEFKKHMGASSVELIPNTNRKESKPMQTEQDWIKTINELLEGKQKPTNEFIAYLIDQVREIRAEGQMLEKEVAARSQQLEQLKLKTLNLQAIMSQYVEDIKKWLERENQINEFLTPIQPEHDRIDSAVMKEARRATPHEMAKSNLGKS